MKVQIDLKEGADEDGVADSPLQCSVQGDLLVITIGVGRLAFCATRENGGPLDGQVLDERLLAVEVIAELTKEEEDGTTPLVELIDQAFESASDNGSTALHLMGDKV